MRKIFLALTVVLLSSGFFIPGSASALVYTVSPQSPDPVTAGQSAAYSARINASGINTTHDVSISVSDLPAGTTASFSSPICQTVPDDQTIIIWPLTLTTSSALTPLGTNNFTITGTRYVSADGTCTGGTDSLEQPGDRIANLNTVGAVTADILATDKTYDGTNSANISSCQVAGVRDEDIGNVNCSTAAATFSDQNAGVGKIVTATGIILTGPAADKYELSSTTATTNATIDKKDLSVAANDQSMNAGSPDPIFTMTYDGFVSGEDENMIDSAPTVSVPIPHTATGTYPITASNGTDNNYNFIDYESGTLSVSPGPVDPVMSTVSTTPGPVTADGGTLAQVTVNVKDQYGNPIVGLAASKVVLSATGVGQTIGQPSLPTNNDGTTIGQISSSVAETKTITAIIDGVVLAAGATITFSPGILHHIDITPTGPQNVNYGDAISFSAQGYDANNNPIPGLIYNWSVIPGTGTGDIDSNGVFTATSIGTSIVHAQSGTISEESDVTIGQRPITVTANGQTKIYGQDDPELTYQITAGSLVFSDAFTGALVRVAGEDVGLYEIQRNNLALNANYDLTYIPANIEITPAELTITATANDKIYDGTTNAIATLQVNGMVFGDEITANYASANFNNRNAGENKNVTISGITILGTKIANYTFNDSAAATANITRRDITVTAATDSKTYDGNTVSVGLPRITDGTLATGDNDTGSWTQTFDNKNAGEGKTLTPAGTVNDGNGGNNYLVNFIPDYTGQILPKDLIVTATGVDKVYDGSTSADVIYTTDAFLGDDVTASGIATFDTENAGDAKPISVTEITLSGADALNYNLTTPTASATANISKRDITVTAAAKTKVFGTSDPELTYVSSENPENFGDSFEGALEREIGEGFGTYAILQGTLSLDTINYILTFNGADFAITKAIPVITWENPADMVYETALDATQLNATADVLGAFTYTPDFATVLSAGLHTLSVTFTPDDIANYEIATAEVTINVLKADPQITWADSFSVVAGTVLGTDQLNATADVAGSFVYTPGTGATFNTIGEYTLFTEFTPEDTANYNNASKSVTLSVFAGPIATMEITASPTSLKFGETSVITITGKDEFGNVVTNDNSTQVALSADNGGAFDNTILTLTEGVATANLTKDDIGVVHVTAQSGVLPPVSATVEFTEADTSSPEVQSTFPANSATNVAVTVAPYLLFSEQLDPATITSETVQLKKTEDEAISASVSMDFLEGKQRVVITPANPLDFSIQYYFFVSDGVKDLAGNSALPVESSFTTAEDTTTLAVTSTNAVKTYATADSTYENGWSWEFNVTVPTSETQLQMKFSDWTSSLNTIATANNVRYSSAQADNGFIELTTANEYGLPLNLMSDLDPAAAGRQIKVLVEVKIPTGSEGGSYSASYGIKSF